MGVRAAMLPGTAATTLANTSAPTPMSTTDTAGMVGSGTALDLADEEVPEEPAEGDAERYADHAADPDRHTGLPGDRAGQLSFGESERFQERKVGAPPSDRGDKGQAECNDGSARQCDAQQDRRRSERSIVEDFGWPLDAEDRAAITSYLRELVHDRVE